MVKISEEKCRHIFKNTETFKNSEWSISSLAKLLEQIFQTPKGSVGNWTGLRILMIQGLLSGSHKPPCAAPQCQNMVTHQFIGYLSLKCLIRVGSLLISTVKDLHLLALGHTTRVFKGLLFVAQVVYCPSNSTGWWVTL